MALNFFKKEKDKSKLSPKLKSPSSVSNTEKAEPKKSAPATNLKKPGNIQAYQVLKAPHISEQATLQAEIGQYVFRVFEGTTKNEIKKAVENLFDVKVTGVNLNYSPTKKRRLGRQVGFRSGYKKAIVTLAKGQTIELINR
ncbi:MAG: 50S ribosomal protein L23 [Candidatus Yanofskybacteria bacterium CG10_big_fil_rev_8_21_14_0_10_46_23]|uniref:Large ribosomal subunit protein uL23 n=1 Tax=Candidatus Yanofskybacteria bacterium CG10_big_fil_rev_8_21_14_0_10_46_23 TaxID=1975098 RepID=A0A2H0R3V6_9BACT|nr:MAG: 50S ribosomal protein L23 [Candidatus Yanofskybacteria bacterium CG10_big_fil_rev_8_21_14_0_10_46_23]